MVDMFFSLPGGRALKLFQKNLYVRFFINIFIKILSLREKPKNLFQDWEIDQVLLKCHGKPYKTLHFWPKRDHFHTQNRPNPYKTLGKRDIRVHRQNPYKTLGKRVFLMSASQMLQNLIKP